MLEPASAPDGQRPFSYTEVLNSTPSHADNALTARQQPMAASAAMFNSLAEERFLGLPKSLILMLMEVYFETAYNANLLLHKRLCLESFEAGTTPAHTVLSICAWGAK